ncbi:uncharacterized protein LOC132755711 [Ruditapes philippinarum]|uniref:uncharacterized protein LOC132755711 n=1 Tax=Ruditapes philippinarum TaxID=129788 RepID=UPI00295B9510|nr:uncharacterized protein LOC132755711 [Ruditapes philippinarum]
MTPTKSVLKKKKIETDSKRYNRAVDRQKNRDKHHVARVLLELQSAEFVATPYIPEQDTQGLTPFNEVESETCTFTWKGKTEGPGKSLQPCKENDKEKLNELDSRINSEIQRLLSENMALKSELNSFYMNQESFKEDNEKVKYYTGLPNYLTLMVVMDLVSPFLKMKKNMRLGAFERVLLTLMRLKHNFPLKDLAYRFKTSSSTVSRIFTLVIHIMFVRMKHFIYWPEREELQTTMPLEFRKHFARKTSVIIDCFEIFIARPKALLARAQTWSNYKHHNTVKFLIGITPQGSISYISNGWGGRASDKYITEACGILDNLLPGDLVLADRGFDIADSVGVYCAEVNIPSFTRGKSQLSATDVETTRKIAHVRIHVERVIGLVRNKYTILQDKIPIDFLIHEKDEVPTIDKIVNVCCALTNMNESVVGFD